MDRIVDNADTEIDWNTYMQQVQQYIDGERDYPTIKGDTGPLVYPAMHLYVYRGLYQVTQNGRNIVLAQVYFSVLYIFNLGLAMMCYKEVKVTSMLLLSLNTAFLPSIGTAMDTPYARTIEAAA